MSSDLNTIKQALEMFKSDEHGLYLAGTCFDISLNVFGNHNSFEQQNKGRIEVANNLNLIQQDLWNIATLIERLVWMRKEGDNNQHIDNYWHQYVAVDIEHFHTEIRSILDYISKSIGHALGLSGQLPKSFRKLREGIDKYRKIPENVSSIISNANWFSELRGVRDALIHQGANTIVFGGRSEGILFQILKNDVNRIIDKEIFLFNPNVVYFDRYAAYYFCHLVVLLESIFTELSREWAFKMKFGPTRSFSPGYGVIQDWATNLAKEIET